MRQERAELKDSYLLYISIIHQSSCQTNDNPCGTYQIHKEFDEKKKWTI